MALTRDQVAHVARLADLALESEEIERLTGELGVILEHIAQLDELDTSDVEPTAHVSLDRMPLRADEVRPGLDHSAALSQSPSVKATAFAVPKFLDEG